MTPGRPGGSGADSSEASLERGGGTRALRLAQASFDHAPGGMFWIRPDGRILRANRAAADLLGYTREELQSLHVWHLDLDMSPEGWPAFWETLRQEASLVFRARPEGKDGVRIPVDAWVRHLEIEEEELALAFIRDLRESLQAEAALKESEARYRAVVEDQTELIVRFLPDGTRIFVNQAYARYFGAPQKDLLGTSIFGEVLPEESEWARNELSAITPGEPVRAMDRAFTSPDGSSAVRQWIIRGFFDEEGNVVEYQSVGRDVTEERRAQEALRLTQFTVDHSQDAVFWAGPDGRLIYVNETACTSLGFSRDELLAMKVMDVDVELGEGDWPGHVEDLARRGFVQLQSRHRRKDGGAFPVEVRSSFLEFEGKRYIVGVVRNLTEKQRLESQLRQAQKMEAIGQLTGGVAHDFNNLMSVILLHAEILSGAPDVDRPLLRAAIDGIEEAAERAAATTKQLLGFSRQATLERRPTDLMQVVRQVAGALARVMPENIDLRISGPERLPAVQADLGALEQMLLNLMNNARDAMPDGGVLEISLGTKDLDRAFCGRNMWAKPGPHVLVSVSDSGRGMPEEVLSRAFEPFFTTKPVGEGTGLGLAMVYGLARQHDGMAEIESEPGRGTTIRLYFPASPGADADDRPASARGRLGGGDETILLVEDEELLRVVGKQVLEQHGYRVLVAEDGQDALDVFLEEDWGIDLVISDVVMPNMGGIELFHTLKEVGASVRFLLASGYPGRQAPTGADLDSSVPFIKKPWRMGELLEKVRNVLDEPL